MKKYFEQKDWNIKSNEIQREKEIGRGAYGVVFKAKVTKNNSYYLEKCGALNNQRKKKN